MIEHHHHLLCPKILHSRYLISAAFIHDDSAPKRRIIKLNWFKVAIFIFVVNICSLSFGNGFIKTTSLNSLDLFQNLFMA